VKVFIPFLLFVAFSFGVELKVYTIIKGKVVKVYVKEGDRVKKGQPLLEIDPILYIAERERLIGKKKEIEASLWKAERDYGRLKELFERDLLAETRLEDQKIKYDTLRARLMQVEGELKRVEALISFGKIVSPVDGRIVKVLAPEGTYVNGELTPHPVVIVERLR